MYVVNKPTTAKLQQQCCCFAITCSCHCCLLESQNAHIYVTGDNATLFYYQRFNHTQTQDSRTVLVTVLNMSWSCEYILYQCSLSVTTPPVSFKKNAYVDLI